MSMNIEKMIRTPLVGIIVTLGFIGCAGSAKAPQASLALKPSKVSSGDVNMTTGVPPGHVEPVAREAQSPRQPRHLVHWVRWPGESLSLIAKWYTGKLNNWKILADFNPKLKPDRIFVGEKILVPEGLLKTREPMPRSFVGQFARKSRKKTSPLAKGDADLPLFGPRDSSSK